MTYDIFDRTAPAMPKPAKGTEPPLFPKHKIYSRTEPQSTQSLRRDDVFRRQQGFLNTN